VPWRDFVFRWADSLEDSLFGPVGRTGGGSLIRFEFFCGAFFAVSWFGVFDGRLAWIRSSSFGIVNLGMLLVPGAVGVRECCFVEDGWFRSRVDGSLMRLLSFASNSFHDTGVALGEGTATERFEPPWCCFSCVTLATH
jgi:hypothetical protein